MSQSPIPFMDLSRSHAPLLAETMQAMEAVLHSSQYILGPAVSEFESDWARYCQIPHAIGFSNGLDALECSLRALGIGQGDEVIVPTNGFVAALLAIEAVGAKAIFCGYDPETFLVTAQDIAPCLTPQTKAVMVVHLYGQAVDMPPILQLVDKQGIPVIEDCAQAHGVTGVGTWGACGAFSFYPTKNLGAAGDAGALITSREDIASFAKNWRNYGGSQRFDHLIPGKNTRMDTLQAAVLRTRLPYLDDWNHQRRALAALYQEGIKRLRYPSHFPLSHRLRCQANPLDIKPVYHLMVISWGQSLERKHLTDALDSAQIGCNVHYPQALHTIAKQWPGSPARLASHLEADHWQALNDRILSLPLFPGLQITEVLRVIDALQSALDLWADQSSSSPSI